ncbi:phosphoribosylaminoimidazole carboxylase [Syncephalis pseudoplumigaleata]|uniref:Phosphoribosylaminoimidazole carboxylase n=1 Tax=Syncephalis pseudoplumigaleata TaxID=1712513 RepID=A0A4P9YXZ4_9FUNG|nr:phosphoribosylaminoimidazole carboxylase [Syncephalis pseudoplumigaleata]|eukprot:RKP24775.1 phosphoribosylaminoimidazole carboxylase [Syncephalis pseudoplumigaleata]
MISSKRVGVLGGGQLGRMMAEAAHRLQIPLHILDPAPQAPAKQLLAHTTHIDAPFTDPEAIRQLATHCDVLTVEIEHVDTAALEQVARRPDSVVEVQPTAGTIALIQDKLRQKEHLRARGVPVPDFVACADVEAVATAGNEFGYPLMLKARRMAYDGRGNAVVGTAEQCTSAYASLGSGDPSSVGGIYAERWAHYRKELAVMVVRSRDGRVVSYPVVETIQRRSVCHLVLAPAPVSAKVAEEARRVAEAAIATLDGAGIFGVELFLMEDDSVVVNEIAPRPHNSGHYTIEACQASQFENHLRAVVGLPLGGTAMSVPAAVMVNLLGSSGMADAAQTALAVPGATVHLYGKPDMKPGRKMGHITVVGTSLSRVFAAMAPILAHLDRAESNADSAAAETTAIREQLAAAPSISATQPGEPVVGIIMGSDSDLPVMRAAAQILEQFDVPFELTIVSAHRTPARLTEYARTAYDRGLRCIIAGAGGAAHLPGMVAAQTSLPVIGVPVKGSTLDGVDSLYSIVQMPRGIPVATVAINNSTNAGLLAVRMLGVRDDAQLALMDRYLADQEAQVMAKVERINLVGYKNY